MVAPGRQAARNAAIKTRPSDGIDRQEKPSPLGVQNKRDPSDGSDTQTPQQAITNPTDAIKASFSQISGLPKPANDNIKPTRVYSASNDNTPDLKKTEGRVTPDAERDTRRLDQRVQDAYKTPGLVQEGAENETARSTQEALDFTRIRNKNRPDDEYSIDGVRRDREENEEFLDNNSQEEFNNNQINPAAIAQALQAEELEQRKANFIGLVKEKFAEQKMNISDEEALLMADSKINFHVKFPWIAFTVFAVLETGQFILGVMFLVFSAILPPIGMAGEVGLPILSAFTASVIIFFWNNYFMNNATDYLHRMGSVKRFLLRKGLNRLWLMLGEAVPVFGNFVPTNTIIIYMIYRSLKKSALKGQRDVEEAKSLSGFSE